MADRSTPNLPSRSFEATSEFYRRLGFSETWRSDQWMILDRGGVTLEFFPFPDLDPATSSFGCCLRLDDVQAFFDVMVHAGVEEKAIGWPRAHRPRLETWGGTVGALIDEDGTLLRLVQEPR